MPGRYPVILKTGDKLPSLAGIDGDFEDWIRRHARLVGNPVRVIDPRRPQPDWPAPDEIAGVVITGSSAMVTDNTPWMRETGHWLMNVIDAQRPVLGICFGHQLLASLLGGVVDYNPRGVEVGTVCISLTDAAQQDPLLADLGAQFSAQASHRQCVLQPPPGAVTLASTALDDYHAFRVGERVWGLQFHPEFSVDIIREYVNYYATDLGQPRHDALQRSAHDAPQQHLPLQRFGELLY